MPSNQLCAINEFDAQSRLQAIEFIWLGTYRKFNRKFNPAMTGIRKLLIFVFSHPEMEHFRGDADVTEGGGLGGKGVAAR
jgi:hypothetical protein